MMAMIERYYKPAVLTSKCRQHRQNKLVVIRFLFIFSLILLGFVGRGQTNIIPTHTGTIASFTSWTHTSCSQGSLSGNDYIIANTSTSLVQTPAMDFSAYSNQTLDFKARTYGGPTAAQATITVSISTNNGSTWTSLGTRVPSTTTLTAMTQFDLSSYTGTQIILKFETLGASSSKGVGIDDIDIKAGGTSSGACGSQGFAGGVTPPSGWTFTGIGGTYTTSTNYGAASPSLKMDDNGDAIETAIVSSVASMKIWIKGQGTDATSALLVEGWDGSTWSTIDNIIPLPTTGTTKTYSSVSSYSQFRYTYTKSVGNLAFDDVIIDCLSSTCSSGCPQMTGALINACNPAGCANEGSNEILFFNTGAYTVTTTNSATAAANIKVYYKSTYPATDNYSESFVSNTTYVNSLNTTAGCTLFKDALTEGSIPPNSAFFIMRQDVCYPYDFSSYCGIGTIYLLFTSDATWNTSGNFMNTADGAYRYFKTVITSSSSAISNMEYTYFTNSLTLHADGDAIAFPTGGGAANSYFNDGCNPTKEVLPIELNNFTVKCENSNIKLSWSTLSETNNDYFTIEKSFDLNSWEYVTTVDGAGNSNSVLNYSYIDENSSDKNYYFRLKQTDFDGQSEYFGPVAVTCDDEISNSVSLYPNPAKDQVICSFYSTETSSVSVEISNYLGQKMFSSKQNIVKGSNNLTLDISQLAAGIYSVSVRTTDGNTFQSKQLVIQ